MLEAHEKGSFFRSSLFIYWDLPAAAFAATGAATAATVAAATTGAATAAAVAAATAGATTAATAVATATAAAASVLARSCLVNRERSAAELRTVLVVDRCLKLLCVHIDERETATLDDANVVCPVLGECFLQVAFAAAVGNVADV